MQKLDDKAMLKIEAGNLEKEDRKLLKKKIKNQKKCIAALAIILNLGILCALKYSAFFASTFDGIFSWFNVTTHFPVLKIGMPIGISYYTLTSIGYVVDIVRGKYPAEKNPFKVALFVCYFPHLYEGPFAKYDELAPQLYEGHDFDLDRVYKGILLITWGLFKKIVIADRFAIIVGAVFNDYKSFNGLIVVLSVICFTIQLYAEFSGLIDIASGISEIFGIRLAKNFEQPFFSQSVNEFWRRWHISLGVWFKEYIFYPISMSKGMMKLNKKMHGKVKPFWELFLPACFALFFVWFANGLWHGADWKYVIYGLYYYVLMIISMCIEPFRNKLFEKLKVKNDAKWLKILRITRTLILVNIGMLIFRANSLTSAFEMVKQIFHNGSLNILSIEGIDVQELVMMGIGAIVLLIVDILKENKKDILNELNNSNFFVKYGSLIVICFVIIIFGAYGNGYLPPDPIYGGF